jgi:hypothetical protein
MKQISGIFKSSGIKRLAYPGMNLYQTEQECGNGKNAVALLPVF